LLFAAEIGDTGAVDGIENFEEALALKLRQNFADGLVLDFFGGVVVEDAEVAGVGEGDAEFGAREAQDGRGGLEEERAEAFALGAGELLGLLGFAEELGVEEGCGDALAKLDGYVSVFLIERVGIDGATEGQRAEVALAVANGDGEQGVEMEFAEAAEMGRAEGYGLEPRIIDALDANGLAGGERSQNGVMGGSVSVGWIKMGAARFVEDGLLAGVAVKADGALDGAIWLQQVKVAEVAEGMDGEMGDLCESDLDVERAGECAAGVGKKLQVAFAAAAVGDVAEDEDDSAEIAVGVVDGRTAVVDGDFGAVAADEDSRRLRGWLRSGCRRRDRGVEPRLRPGASR
jgi:hypothetical protein